MSEREEPRPPAPGPTDVDRLHLPLLREQPEPTEGREPPPWWLWALVALALFGGGFYLGRFFGPFDTRPHVAYLPPGAPPGAPAEAPPATGEELYRTRCVSCHQANGQGLPGQFPPLVDSEWVKGPPEVPVRILLHGLTGPVTVAGQTYAGVMPAWASQLSDAEIAAVVSYLRETWNGAAPVDEALVKAEREATADRTAPYTAAELQGGK